MNGFMRRFSFDERLELSSALGDAANRIEPRQENAIAGRSQHFGNRPEIVRESPAAHLHPVESE